MNTAHPPTTTTHPRPWQQRVQQLLDHRFTTRQLLFIGAVLLCLTPLLTPPMTLLLGLLIAQSIGHPYLHLNSKVTHWLLQASVVGLGFGIDAHSAVSTMPGWRGIVVSFA